MAGMEPPAGSGLASHAKSDATDCAVLSSILIGSMCTSPPTELDDSSEGFSGSIQRQRQHCLVLYAQGSQPDVRFIVNAPIVRGGYRVEQRARFYEEILTPKSAAAAMSAIGAGAMQSVGAGRADPFHFG
jgi:hypothetical protein